METGAQGQLGLPPSELAISNSAWRQFRTLGRSCEQLARCHRRCAQLDPRAKIPITMCDAKVALSRSASKQEDAADEVCWICLSGGGPLERVRKCPSMNAHRACLARWQLQQAGRR